MNYTMADMMVVSIARKLKDAENAFHGVASPVPMVSIMLAKKMYNEELQYLNITGGVNMLPDILEKSTDGDNLYLGSKSSFNLTDIFDLSARGGLDVAFLSGGQVDAKGRINNSVIGNFVKPKVKLPGGAGSAVLVPTTKRAFIWKTKHDKRGFVENVDFVTTQGNVKYIFSPLCTFVMNNGKLEIESIHPYSSLDEIIENTAFEIERKEYPITPEPTEKELSLLHEIDKDNVRECEF